LFSDCYTIYDHITINRSSRESLSKLSALHLTLFLTSSSVLPCMCTKYEMSDIHHFHEQTNLNSWNICMVETTSLTNFFHAA